MSQPTTERYNLLAPDVLMNPYPTYRRMREEAPIYYSALLNTWVLTRYRDVHTLLRDPRLVVAFGNRLGANLSDEQRQSVGPLLQSLARWLPFTNPPDHTRLRGLVQKAFTPRIIATVRPRVQAIVDELLDQVARRGHMDVIADLAYPLPTIVVAELLGARPEDRDQIKAWSNNVALLSSGRFTYEIALRAQEGVQGLMNYFRSILEARPAPDTLLASLLAARDQGDALSTDEILATASTLLFAGHETTTNLIGNGLLALLHHPDQLALLRANPNLIEPAVEELLRYDGPAQFTGRRIAEDIAIDDVWLSAGQSLMLGLGAANHDPAQFADPQRLDITRADNRHVAFGYGVHFCVGSSLARLEGQIAMLTLVQRLPNLRLATDQLAWRPLPVSRGLVALPVTFDSV